MLAQWKSAIRWFFVTAKAQARGEAALARIDRGESEAGSGSKSRATSYGGNDTSTRSGQGGASPSGVGQPGSSGKPSAPQASSEQVGRPAISGFSSENDTDAERIVARSEDEASILKVMRRRGMALKTERSYVSAYRNFVRQSGVTCGGAIKGEHLRSYLDLKRNQVAVRCGKGGEGSCGTALGEVGCRH
jgi:hypothetical protein